MPQVERNPNPLTRGNRSLIPQLFSLLLVILVVYYCLLYPIYYVIVLLFGLVDLVLYYSMYGIHHVVNQFLFSVEWDFLQFVLVFGLLLLSVTRPGIALRSLRKIKDLFFWSINKIIQFFPIKGRRANVEVIFDWKHYPRVGEPSTLKLKLLEKLSVDAKKTRLEAFSVGIRLKNCTPGDGDGKIQCIKETTSTDEDAELVIKFSVRKSGDYEFQILDDSLQHVRGSPFTKNFLPGDLDVETTSFQKPSPCILLTLFKEMPLFVRPKDKFENTCRILESDLPRFNFSVIYADGQKSDLRNPICDYQFYSQGEVVVFKPKFQKTGFFQGEITYDQLTIQQGKFDLVVLSQSEKAKVDEMLQKDTNWIYHQAKLLVVGAKVQKGKKIYIYVGPKQLCVRDYVWKVFPIRVATFRVTPTTKISIMFTDTSSSTHTLSISDGIQKVVLEMESDVARRVVAMYSHFIKQRIGGSESFSSKQKFFYEELRDLQADFRVSLRLLSIDRQDIVGSTMAQTKSFYAKEWYKNFRIEFKGELGVDAGGLKKEWLEILCVKLFEHNPTGLFSSLGNSRLVHPTPAEKRSTQWSLKHYELAGKIVGKCLFESAVGGTHQQMVNGRFSRSFLAQVVGLRPNYRHFEQDDPELYLGKIKFILENDVLPLELTFNEEEYSDSGKLLKVMDLIPNGSKLKVTEENKEDYLQELANYKLGTKVTKEIEAFLKGLHEIVPDELLANFDENELELLWCGKSRFHLEDLQKHFLNGGWNFDAGYARVLKWFWTSISGLSDDEKARLLQFTTGSSLLPHGGFKGLNPAFKISLSSEFGRLPIAHTCINEICLSDNLTFEQFDKLLRIAINEGNQGFEFR